MHPLNPLFALVIFALAFATAYLINTRNKIIFTQKRFETIDGLRGFLALGVFMHHAAIWYFFIHTDVWDVPPSNFYTLLGQGGVSFFFMISAFLFVTKLLNTAGAFDWKYFFVSRMYRLMPAYYFSLALIIIVVFCVTGPHLNIAFPKFLESILNWILFTINKTPAINNYDQAWLVNAGVIWSLPYEWAFYFILPLLALLMLKKKPGIAVIVMSVLFLIAFIIVHGVKITYVLPFIGGSIAPFLIKYTSISKKLNDVHAAVVIAACGFAALQFHTANNIWCILLLTVIFTVIALGRSVFGIFKNPTLQFLGEISYSTYLLHGILLFVCFTLITGKTAAADYSPATYCLIVAALVPVLICTSYLSFRFIEKPFINKQKKRIKTEA